MILVGISGGLRQGKSTVGAELRRLAGVDAKADLEFSYPIGQVCSLWLNTWPPSVLDSGKDLVDIANHLVPLLASPVQEVTGLSVDVEALKLEDTPASREHNNRLLSYLEHYIEAGERRSEEFPAPLTPENKVLHRALLQWVGARLIEEIDAGEGKDVWVHVLEKRIQELDGRHYALLTVGGVRYLVQWNMIRRHGGVMVVVERPDAPADDDVTERAADAETPDVVVSNNGSLEELLAVTEELYADLVAGKPKKRYRAKIEARIKEQGSRGL